jgi:NADH-quinone oxidoreductase subunit G
MVMVMLIEERRTYVDLDMGPVIQKNMNRCIHCTRCIRFGDEIAGIHEMVALKRGNNTEIATIDGRPLETDYAGNYADVCPTGSLTIKDFRFKKRVWFLKKTPTVCEGCSRGCNMEIHQDANTIYRCIPRENMEINKYWLCDEGRFNYQYVNAEDRIIEPTQDWTSSIDQARKSLAGKRVTVLVGSDLTLEEAALLQQFLPKHLPGAEVFHYGTPGIQSTKDDAPADKLLKRRSKTSNLNGLEKLGYKGFEKFSKDTDAVLVIRGGRAALPDLSNIQTVVGLGVFMKPQVEKFSVVLPGTSFAEKDGTIMNYEGREQRIRRAILPPGQCKPLSEICMLWANQKSSSGAA